jgi:endonuclease/exonuclease/phosphatase family metal-dependent hydrolase
LRFESLEPLTRRKEREQLQVQLLRDQNLGAIFLQEVNPVGSRSRDLSEQLGLQRFWGRDNAGVKIGSIGAPFNLDSGLSVLLSEEFVSEWSKSICLSGEKYSGLSQLGSLQWKESRYALLVSVITPKWGRVLFVNTHLHHGLELRENVVQGLEALTKAEKISESVAEEISDRITQADLRRSQEIKRLLDEISSIRDRYSFIILGGDFNSSSESSVIEAISEFGFQALQPEEAGEMKTWDSERNRSNLQFTINFKAPILVDDLSFDKSTVSLLKEKLKSWEMAPRQIDFLYGWSRTGKFEVHDSHLFGEEKGEQLSPSDHLGLCSEISWDSSK